jgi:ubiquitin carboxyl-terminal hydrolase 7
VLVAKNGTIADITSGIQKKLNLDEKIAQFIRIYEVHSGKIYKELSEDLNITGVNEFVSLYAERTPDEEINAMDLDRAIYCFHFDKEPSKPHGVPFKFILKPGETFKDTRERLGTRTGLKGKLLEKISGRRRYHYGSVAGRGGLAWSGPYEQNAEFLEQGGLDIHQMILD